MTMAISCASLFVAFVATGFLPHNIIGGESPEIFLEIPPYRMPDMRSLFKKTFISIREFLKTVQKIYT